MNLQILRYLLQNRNFKESRRLGLPQMGFGIERRRKSLSVFWEPHLEKCRLMQEQWTRALADKDYSSERSELKNRSLAVLGAGRLFDVNRQTLSASFSKIVLIDADPFCIPFWQKWKVESAGTTEISWTILEVCGLIDRWRATFEKETRRSSWQHAMKVLAEIHHLTAKQDEHSSSGLSKLPRPHSILSLNLLSQIPIVWQDCVERTLGRRFSPHRLKADKQEWLDTFYPSARTLISRHLANLATLGARRILLLSDLEYATYSGPLDYRSKSFSPPPLRWESNPLDPTMHGQWLENETSTKKRQGRKQETISEVRPALYGLDLEDKQCLRTLIPGYRSKTEDSWIWHIQPQGTEDRDKGIIHRVGAFALIKEDLDE